MCEQLFDLCFLLLTVKFCYKNHVAISESRKTNMGKLQKTKQNKTQLFIPPSEEHRLLKTVRFS